jgi:two-component system chemotaxis response regulator CheB
VSTPAAGSPAVARPIRKLRVLVCDDSVVVRRILTDVIGADPELEVAGVAANGKIALAKIAQVQPDVVTLDVEMPEMDGLEAVREIRKTHPRLPVIMFSTLTERGAEATIEALTRGASDYVAKPSNVGSVGEAIRRISTDLIGKIKALCGRDVARHGVGLATRQAPTPAAVRPGSAGDPAAPPPPRPPPRPAWGATAAPVKLLAVGASTGGPVALAAVLGKLRADFPVPVVVTQHMPPMFTRLLAERLSACTPVRFAEGKAGERLEPGRGYVAPGDFHMSVVRDPAGHLRLALDQGPQENSCRPAVDALFRSAAAAVGPGVLSVVLTGMGQDGMVGARHVVSAGGQVVAQDEATSVVWGMPGAVVREGLASRVLPLDQIAAELNRRVPQARAA